MRRYLAILGMAALLATPVVAGAQMSDKERTSEAARLAEILARKGVITRQELAEVSTPASTAPQKTKSDQERDSSNPYLRGGLFW